VAVYIGVPPQEIEPFFILRFLTLIVFSDGEGIERVVVRQWHWYRSIKTNGI
jgi:hypothetical protein